MTDTGSQGLISGTKTIIRIRYTITQFEEWYESRCVQAIHVHAFWGCGG